ncbi:MAG: hypothetical protein J1E03_10295 [Acetatifactor sp.]|nr:hypothetical protein [Acetatifactor sp.]
MKKEELFEILGNIDETHIGAARTAGNKTRRPGWTRWAVSAACLCLAVGLGALMFSHPQDTGEGGFVQNNGGNGFWGGDNGFWGSGDSELLPVHREDFTPGLTDEAVAAFAGVPGVFKTYRLLNNSWFLAEDLTDFSQVLTEQVIYVVPGSMEGIGGSPEDGAYSLYSLDENGEVQWGMGRSAPQNPIRQMVPYEFSWLTDEIIREDLAGVDYEDYIIAESTRLYTVFVWARCADGEDMFVTYPARPEFVGLENRSRYTLAEVQQILTESCR